jgi:hypothetical protein
MTDEPISVVFSVACSDPRAWVVLTGDGMPPRVIEMWQPRLGFWSACAVVPPGAYRCRCYGGTGRTYTYCGPPFVDGGTECGLDTLIIVRGATTPDTGPQVPSHPYGHASSGLEAYATNGDSTGRST